MDSEEVFLLADGPVKVLISSASAEEIVQAYGRLVIQVCIAAGHIEELLNKQPGDLNDNPSEERGRTH